MKKIDLLNAIDAFGYSTNSPSYLIKNFAADHLRALLDKLPDEIQEKNSVIDPCAPEDPFPQGAKSFSKVSRSDECCKAYYKQAEYEG